MKKAAMKKPAAADTSRSMASARGLAQDFVQTPFDLTDFISELANHLGWTRGPRNHLVLTTGCSGPGGLDF